MEVEGEDGSKVLLLKNGAKTVFGRGSGFNTNDRTVSRRHVQLEFETSGENRTEPRISFEVIGQNPIWVRSKRNGEIRMLRKLEKGELEVGDGFCLSGKEPIWFNLKQVSEVQETEKRVLESENEISEILPSGIDFDSFDISGVDPVKEFGFVVMGHEFDQYPKEMIHNVKNWDWFFEEPKKDSDDEDDFEKKGRRGMTRKRKVSRDNEYDVWNGESEDDNELVENIRKVHRSRYSTRTRDREKPTKDTKSSKNSMQKNASKANEYIGYEDDETLGGFIVNDEVEQEEENDEDEEEEEFEEDDDDDDDEMDD
ncbi:putative SMAD/FHA domain-containing protein [Quillaja saponaria]|uniref:SMAD/FHA domain-containing protein n=1 Tax=Quillaja saponaria TaxID=32244 RepID=A0AAD7PYM1_QUISA|nr:putative SMAD/FHA domain-containing protein [Quillaja saponaria]